MRVSHVVLFVAAALALLAPVSASSQSLDVTVGDAEGATVGITVANTYYFDVTLVNVRIAFENIDGSQTFYFSAPGLTESLAAGETWEGPLTFAAADGSAPPADVDWGNYDRLSAAGGVDLNALEADAQAALEDCGVEGLREQLAIVRSRVAPVSRSARFHAEQLAGSGLPVAQWFDLERIYGIVARIEQAICAEASTRYLRTRASAQPELYATLGGELREVDLHINCLSTEAKLAAAAALIRNERAQDALVLVEREDGVPTEAWRGIFIQGSLALARTAAALQVTAFTAIRPALQALNDVHALEPDNADLQRIANVLIPNAAQWMITATEPMTRDLANAEIALQMLRPTWSRFEQIEVAAGRFASAMIEDGLEQCRTGNFVNSRNRFDRGERILTGVPEWEARAEEINRCRALGALQEGREIAGNVNDDNAPARGFAKLDEAQSRFDLEPAEIDAFKNDIADAWVAIALRQIEDERDFPGAIHSLGEAEAVAPNGRTATIQDAWLRYAEQLHAQYGMLMTGEQVDDAQAAIARADGVDAARIEALEGKLTLARYGYRVGIPVGVIVLGLLGVLLAVLNRRKAAKLAAQLEDLE